ncbi:flagellar biosynthetic protein FliO [Janthinobacterium sp. GW460P]|uniref:flagellar biosynthetic protein FliO n=1 Tax=unclassified Janthinobacterium TaxID=2610881 RepID=UPI000A3268EC|nr:MULTISPECIES: flagellar biosynthetic protein FliO [unclassified Janthinobacterium]MCC7705603.1 flagellar biosynthetic protein FliO [Janthinobacterium sp. GW460P]MCC7711105.1 flagellar biosynthetic protein FliO [Janthinobacterium sp. GW460W]
MRRGIIAVLACSWSGGAALAAQSIPFKRDTEAGTLPGSGSMAVLLVSLLAIVVIVFVRKRLKLGLRANGAPALLRVLETRRLGPRSLISVVEFGGKQHLLVQGEHGITCIDTIMVDAPPGDRELSDAR